MRLFERRTRSLTTAASNFQGRSEWESARVAWSNAIKKDKSADNRNVDLVSRFYLNMAMCEFFLGSIDDAAMHLRQAGASAAVRELPEYSLLTARLLRRTDPRAALEILRALKAKVPNNTPVLYEFCSVALQSGDAAEALPVVEHLTMSAPDNASFRLLSIDIAERCGEWLRALAEMRALLALQPLDVDANKRLIMLFGTLGDLKQAKRAAVALARHAPERAFVWQLMLDVYERAGSTTRARLVCRFLTRLWPHSQWHRFRYAEFLAADGKLNAADRVLASVPPGDEAAERAYDQALWRVAKSAGSRHETLARLVHLRSRGAVDFESEIAFGYALADVEGVEAARAHFYGLSIRTRFHRRVMHGLAHMAVRERDASATLAAWRRAAEVHPDDAYALREYCRSLFETGEGEAAIALCRGHLAEFHADRAFVEFYVWLCTAVGAFEETLAFCEAHMRSYANPWQLLESGLVCAGYLGRMEAFLDLAMKGSFYIAYAEDVQRLYGVLRIASIRRREHLLADSVHVTGDLFGSHPWLRALAKPNADGPAPGSQSDGVVPTAPRSERLYAGSRYEPMVGGATVAAFDRLSENDIVGLLGEPGRGARKIYIFSKFEQARGGSELHALDLADRLRDYAEVELWAPSMCHASFTTSGLVRVIDPANGDLPAPGGVIVLVGLYFDLGPYVKQIDPFRIVALYNTFEATKAVARIEALYKATGVPVDLLYCSEMIGRELGLPGVFEPSPTDLDAFRPGAAAPGNFVLGRHSRDVVEKHHPEDAAVYRAVSALGGQSVVLGGLSMQETFGPIPGLKLLPATNKGIADYLQSLSCYFYRTSTWVEPWGRVVIEALACGVPVVAHRLGGYAEAITHGENGFLFDETAEAIDKIGLLMRDPDLQHRMSQKARRSAERIVGPAAMRRLAAFYLFAPPAIDHS